MTVDVKGINALLADARGHLEVMRQTVPLRVSEGNYSMAIYVTQQALNAWVALRMKVQQTVLSITPDSPDAGYMPWLDDINHEDLEAEQEIKPVLAKVTLASIAAQEKKPGSVFKFPGLIPPAPANLPPQVYPRQPAPIPPGTLAPPGTLPGDAMPDGSVVQPDGTLAFPSDTTSLVTGAVAVGAGSLIGWYVAKSVLGGLLGGLGGLGALLLMRRMTESQEVPA